MYFYHFFTEAFECINRKHVPSHQRRRCQRSPGNSERTELTAQQRQNGNMSILLEALHVSL